MRLAPRGKESFMARFRERHWLRFHMTLILLTTAMSGTLASKLLLLLSMEEPMLRYPLAVLLAYTVFFLCIKLWLGYVRPARKQEPGVSDLIDLPTPSFEGSGAPPLSGGGGEFSGAGASGSFDLLEGAAPVTDGVGNAVGDVVGDTVGEAAGALGEEAGVVGIVVLGVLAAIVAVIMGSAVYMIAEAPLILSEAAFEGLLAVSLVRKTRVIDEADWIGSVFRTTWRPFAITMGVAFLAAVLLNWYLPEATRLSDLFR